MTRTMLPDPDDRDQAYLDWLQRDLRLHLAPDAVEAVDVPGGWRPLPAELAARLYLEARGHDG